MPGVNTWFPTSKRPDPPKPNVDDSFVSCPNDDGKSFTTSDGTFYSVKCQLHTIAANTPSDKIKTVSTETFALCMEACSEEEGCISVDYVARTGDHKVKDCDLFKSGGGDTPTTSCASSELLLTLVMVPEQSVDILQSRSTPPGLSTRPLKITLTRDQSCVALNVLSQTAKL